MQGPFMSLAPNLSPCFLICRMGTMVPRLLKSQRCSGTLDNCESLGDLHSHPPQGLCRVRLLPVAAFPSPYSTGGAEGVLRPSWAPERKPSGIWHLPTLLGSATLCPHAQGSAHLCEGTACVHSSSCLPSPHSSFKALLRRHLSHSSFL